MRNIILMLTMAVVLLAGTVQAAQPQYTANFVPYMVTDPSMCPDPMLAVHSKDVKAYNDMINLQMVEMATSASAQVQDLITADAIRINSFIAQLETKQAAIKAAAPADYPATHRLWYCLHRVDPESLPVVSSLIIRELLVEWTLTLGELNQSDSSMLPAGITVPDDIRLTSHIASMKHVLGASNTSVPADYPRSAEVTDRIKSGSGISR